jgi:hypothetical protein
MTDINILQQVITYQKSGLAALTNQNCFVSTANKKFKDFENREANLGDTVSFDLPPRFVTQDGLVVSFGPAVQRIQNLTVDQSENVSFAYSAQQFIFNVDKYMNEFGMGAIAELGAQIEANIALNCETGPYRFYGNGVTAITTYKQLAVALANMRNFGAPKTMAKGYLSDLCIPDIIDSGLSQFALNRNNENANSWELGKFDRAEWFTSNMLPIHVAGTEGIQNTTLTVVSVTKDANNAITNILFSGTNAANDANSIKIHDRFQFQDGVGGQPNVRFLTFTGHIPSSQPVQFRATANATSTGASQVNVAIYPPLKAAVGQDQNITTEIVAGMQVKVLPTHRVGMITCGDPLFLAMPKLPDQRPFDTASTVDKETGVSLRQYYGTLFGQNKQGMVYDCIWGSTLVPEYSQAIIFPV